MLIFKQKNPVFAARILTLNKQYLHSSHQIYNEKYYFLITDSFKNFNDCWLYNNTHFLKL